MNDYERKSCINRAGRIGLMFAFLFFFITLANAQVKNATGIIVDDESGEPLVGASITVKGTAIGCISDLDGKFTFLQTLSEQQQLVVSYIGMTTVEVPVRRGVMNIRMRANNELEEVVVQVAYGTAKRKSLTGSVSVVDEKQFEMRPVTTVTSALDGLAAGVQITDAIGQPGVEAGIRIRGYSSVYGNNDPLYVIDGVPYGSSVMGDFSPADIESISVLKDAASCALYGSRASNGVVLITTKKAKTQKLSMQLDIKQGLYTRGQSDYETMNPNQFMEAMWKGYRNGLISGGKSLEVANQTANDNIIDVVGINIYNKADDALFDGSGHLVSDARILDAYQEDLDWYKPYIRNGQRQEYNLSGNTGNEKAQMRFSLGYLKEDGFTKNSGYDRLNGRVAADFTPYKWLKTGLTLAGTHQNADWNTGISYNSTANSTNSTNAFFFIRRMSPLAPVHLHYADDVLASDGSVLHAKGDYMLDESGNRQYDDGSESRAVDSGSKDHHLIWESEENKHYSIINTMMGNAYADFSFLQDFTFTVKGTVSLRDDEERLYSNSVIGQYKGIGRYSLYNKKYKEKNFQELLTWNHTFGKHFVEWMGAHENFDYEYKYMNQIKENETTKGICELSNFVTTKKNEGYTDTYRTEGYFTRARYNYDETYFAEASFRRDASSIFHKDNRWGNFWSMGLAWTVSNEAFLQNVDWLDHLKLRASYGEVGNDNFSNDNTEGFYQWADLYSPAVNGGEGAYYKTQNGNKDLKWETNSSLDFGVEARLFDRLNVTFDYFDKRSSNLLFKFQQPLSSGAVDIEEGTSIIWRNIGKVSNRGWELAVDGDIIRNRDWNWNVGVSLSKVKNKIGKLPDKDKTEGILAGNYHKYMEGHSIYDFWLYQYAGVDQMTGQAVYEIDFDKYYVVGEDGTPTDGQPASGRTKLTKDYVNINNQYYSNDPSKARKDFSGSALPKITGSFSTSLSWKDLTLSALLTFSCGAKVLDLPYQMLTITSISAPHALSTELLDAWSEAPEGMTETSASRLDPSGIPALNGDVTISGYNTNEYSTRYLKSGDYLNIKNITLSYRLPAAWSRRATLSDIRVYGAVENAALFTSRKGLNPMQSFDGIVSNRTSIARIFTLGVSVKL